MIGLIRAGDRSEQVADVQARLRALGMSIDDEPAVFGEATAAAVRAFQQRRGLIADGIVGRNTWTELVEAGWRLGDRILYFKHPPLRGDDVMTLQAHLNALGFDAGREDGIFGRDTDIAVRAFQREYGVAGDGIVGPHTTGSLTGLRINRPMTAAALREELRRSAQAGLRGALIVVDPGHGGSDRGERGREGAWEADICWDLARRLADRLSSAGARVRFTRTEAEGPDDSERAGRANALGGQIFLSIHLNAHSEPTAEGSSSFYWRTSKAGAALADLMQQELAELGQRDCRSHPSSYAILRETKMTAVLVEPSYITNPDDEKRLMGIDFRGAVAGRLAQSIRRYFEDG
ncbi:MAG: N-acetylmuramoyl-L-alanine amidase [Actinomycetota bacterium]